MGYIFAAEYGSIFIQIFVLGSETVCIVTKRIIAVQGQLRVI